MWLREVGESDMSCTELMQVQLLVCDDDDDDDDEEEEEEDYVESIVKFSTRRKFLERLNN
jgi:hypothetical protein